MLLSLVLQIQVVSFRCSPNLSCDSSCTQITDVYSLHDKVLIRQISNPQGPVYIVSRDQTKCNFLHSDMFICRQFEVGNFRGRYLLTRCRHVTSFCRHVEYVRENKDLEFQSPVRCLDQFLKPGNMPPGMIFTVMRKWFKMSFKGESVINFDASQFKDINGSISGISCSEMKIVLAGPALGPDWFHQLIRVLTVIILLILPAEVIEIIFNYMVLKMISFYMLVLVKGLCLNGDLYSKNGARLIQKLM